MVIPYGAIVVDVSARPEEGHEKAFEVVFCRRGADGRYGEEERAIVRSRQRREFIRQAIESGQASFWGGWFGIEHQNLATGDPSMSTPIFSWSHREMQDTKAKGNDV